MLPREPARNESLQQQPSPSIAQRECRLTAHAHEKPIQEQAQAIPRQSGCSQAQRKSTSHDKGRHNQAHDKGRTTRISATAHARAGDRQDEHMSNVAHDLHIAVRYDLDGAPFDMRCKACGLNELVDTYERMAAIAENCQQYPDVQIISLGRHKK